MLDGWDWTNLWSGGAGAVLGAIASIGILIGTNWWTRRMSQEALANQSNQFAHEQSNAKLQFEAEQGEARRQFEQQRISGREMAREGRELEVVAELLTWLQVEHLRRPLSEHLMPELMAICNRLTLNSTETVADGWRARSSRETHSLRVERHPLAIALVPWAAAYSLSQVFPDIMGVTWREPVDVGTVVSDLTGADAFPRQSLIAVERVSRQMLRWGYLTDEQKIVMFDPLVQIAKDSVQSVFAAVNYSLGWNGGGEQPYWRLMYRETITEMLSVMRDVVDIDDRAALSAIRRRIDELGGETYRPEQLPGMGIVIEDQDSDLVETRGFASLSYMLQLEDEDEDEDGHRDAEDWELVPQACK